MTTTALLRKLGHDAMVKYAERDEEPLEKARRAVMAIVKSEFDDLIAAGVLPKGLLIREFRIGWRGVIDFTHGKPSGYTRGCRCRPCSNAWRKYQIEYRRNRHEKAAGELLRKFEDDLAQTQRRLAKNMGVIGHPVEDESDGEAYGN